MVEGEENVEYIPGKYDISVATRFGVVLILSCISFSSSVSCGVDSLVYFLL